MLHYNPSISYDVQRILNLKGENISEVQGWLTPTIEIQPVINIIKQNTANNATSATIWTTPTDKDFYVVAVQMTTIKDATATSTYSYLAGVLNGVGFTFFQLPLFTLTVQTLQAQLAFPLPIKLDRGTAITVNNATANGNISSNAIVYGYLVETVKGV